LSRGLKSLSPALSCSPATLPAQPRYEEYVQRRSRARLQRWDVHWPMNQGGRLLPSIAQFRIEGPLQASHVFQRPGFGLGRPFLSASPCLSQIKSVSRCYTPARPLYVRYHTERNEERATQCSQFLSCGRNLPAHIANIPQKTKGRCDQSTGPGLVITLRQHSGTSTACDDVSIQRHCAIPGQRSPLQIHASSYGDGCERQDIPLEHGVGTQRCRTAHLPEDIAGAGPVGQNNVAAASCNKCG
jgi:hypothetical protein